MRLEALERAFLVGAHQSRVARHIGGEDRGETAFDGLFHSLPQPLRLYHIRDRVCGDFDRG
jgi:hypothetical protein